MAMAIHGDDIHVLQSCNPNGKRRSREFGAGGTTAVAAFYAVSRRAQDPSCQGPCFVKSSSEVGD